MLKRRRAAKVFGSKKLAVITGASSGLGLQTTAELLQTGEYHVFAAVRDVEKMQSIANDEGFSADDFTPLEVDLGSFESVHDFRKALNKAKLNRPIDRLICNAAVYKPADSPEWSEDGCPQELQVNFLSHFLMVSHQLTDMAKASDPRVIFVGGAAAEESVAVYPRADLGGCAGLKAGLRQPISMVDGFNYQSSKAYKDSKLCLSMLSRMLHERYHKQTGISFSTVHLGAIGDSALLKDKPPLDTSPFGGLREIVISAIGMAEGESVSTVQAAQRLFQVAHDGRCSKSGVYWSWLEGTAAEEASKASEDDVQLGGKLRPGWEAIYEKEPSEQVLDFDTSQDLMKHSTLVTSAAWPPAYVPRSPCPTLVVVGAVTKAMNAKEDAKRTLEGLEPEGTGSKVPLKSLGAKVLGGTGFAIDAVAGNTVGRAGKLVQEKLLGGMVDEALEGSYQETVDAKEGKAALRKQKQELDAVEALEEVEIELPAADELKNNILAKALQHRIDELEVDTGSETGSETRSL